MAPISSLIKNLINNSSDSIKRVKTIIMATNFKNGAQKDWMFFVAKNPDGRIKEKQTPPTPPPQRESSSVDKKPDFNKTQEEQTVLKESEPWLSQIYFNLDIPKLFEEIKQKITTSGPTEPKVPPWKSTVRPQMSLEAIDSKTTHLLSLISSSESSGSRLKRLEDFLAHMIAHPSAKQHAVEKGAIILLCDLLSTSNDISTTHVIRQSLVTLGFVEPPRSSGVRILSIDGGGMRGIAVVNMLEKLEKLSGRRVLDLFDFVCGVSTGAIIICCLMPPHSMSLKEVKGLYTNLSAQVFSQSAIRGTSKLVWNHAYYDTAVWEKLLKSYVGETKMLDSAKYGNCPKIATVSTIINQNKVAPYIFRNYANPCYRKSEYSGGLNHSLFEAVRASAAAPTIFEEFRIGDLLHQDGGMVVNNPSAVAIHEARTLWPDEQVSCLVSCGTGKLSARLIQPESPESKQASSSWRTILNKVLESATDTEAVHNMLNDLLPEHVYYRINPHLSRKVTMDEVNETTITLLETDTEMYYRRNKEKFQEIVQQLIRPRSKVKKCHDYVSQKIRMII